MAETASDASAEPMDARAYYDEFARRYDDARHRGYHALVDELESELALRHASGGRVLEVGCGTGLILERLAPRAVFAAGIDLSGGMLRRAKDRGLRVAQASATALPFPDGAFDAAVSFKVLAHVEAIDDALAEIARVVRPGGRLVLEFYNARSLRRLAKGIAGPRRIGEKTTEAAVFTRFDTLRQLERRLPPTLRLLGVSGVRIFTPAAFVHRIPVVRGLFAWAERAARDTWLARHAGFLVLVLAREPEPR